MMIRDGKVLAAMICMVESMHMRIGRHPPSHQSWNRVGAKPARKTGNNAEPKAYGDADSPSQGILCGHIERQSKLYLHLAWVGCKPSHISKAEFLGCGRSRSIRQRHQALWCEYVVHGR